MYSSRFSALLASLVVFASPTLAETVSAKGVGHGASSTQAMPVSEGLVAVHVSTMYKHFETENPNNPFAAATGPCFGAILIDKGAVSGDGLCHYTDGDGDVAVIRWTAKGLSAEGRTQGEWMVKGGTGKWASITGGGTFDAGGQGDDYTNVVDGELTLN
ncbi:hypothetical protein [Maliponia aquimaris]|uniref:Uncharacterized protein n=1 Tax=Maliponia aquimaris TaxID=1673631 RepID=A0A238K5U3_9RHOB|nr:hypothetical protein [Maliponia aquimaris]SMX38271.1 hypothetical protein MAA8898_01460 [Maliponia aquimaris]